MKSCALRVGTEHSPANTCSTWHVCMTLLLHMLLFAACMPEQLSEHTMFSFAENSISVGVCAYQPSTAVQRWWGTHWWAIQFCPSLAVVAWVTPVWCDNSNCMSLLGRCGNAGCIWAVHSSLAKACGHRIENEFICDARTDAIIASDWTALQMLHACWCCPGCACLTRSCIRLFAGDPCSCMMYVHLLVWMTCIIGKVGSCCFLWAQHCSVTELAAANKCMVLRWTLSNSEIKTDA